MGEHSEYETQSAVTDLGVWREWCNLSAIGPAEVPAPVRALVVHMDHAEGADESRRRDEPPIINVADLLERLHELDPQPPAVTREPVARVIGHCRTTSVLGCAFYRELGVAARVCVGFAAYYAEGRDFLGNHWVIEVWDAQQSRWRFVDAELDAATIAVHAIGFDPDDVPPDQFVVAGQAWLACRSGRAPAERFAPYPAQTGLTEVAAQLTRDAASLAMHEVGPFDSLLPEQLSAAQCNELDELAETTMASRA